MGFGHGRAVLNGSVKMGDMKIGGTFHSHDTWALLRRLHLQHRS